MQVALAALYARSRSTNHHTNSTTADVGSQVTPNAITRGLGSKRAQGSTPSASMSMMPRPTTPPGPARAGGPDGSTNAATRTGRRRSHASPGSTSNCGRKPPAPPRPELNTPRSGAARRPPRVCRICCGWHAPSLALSP